MIICVGEETNCTEIILFNDGKLSVPVFLSSIETTINIKQRLNNFLWILIVSSNCISE